MEILKTEVQTIPIWVKLPKLDIKYWGEKCWPKIVSNVGKMIKLDNAH